MNKSKIYTKTGDSGETGLVSGNRISKADPRINVYGDLDELNSRIGVVSSLVEDKALQGFLHEIQSRIFDLGSNLACEEENRSKYNLPQLTEAFIHRIEAEIDRLDNGLDPLKNFILPGGTQSAAYTHLCRTGAREVERKLIAFHEEAAEKLPAHSAVFLNRLSDYFFVLARHLNKQAGDKEITWKAHTST